MDKKSCSINNFEWKIIKSFGYKSIVTLDPCEEYIFEIYIPVKTDTGNGNPEVAF